MQKTDGSQLLSEITLEEISKSEGCSITFGAFVHKIKKAFVMLRTGRYVLQGVYSKKNCEDDISTLCEGAYVKVTGVVKKEGRADLGYEIVISSFELLSKPEEEYPLPIFSKTLECDVDTTLDHRGIALRHPDLRAVFKIREGITGAFLEFMKKNNFTEIHTPKIVSVSTEGNNNAFKIDYFDNNAYLAQSPQLYKQSCVAVFDRVFEITPVFTAQKRSSMRHLNEYTSLDFEMGFINDMHDVITMQTAMLKFMVDYLAKNYAYELEMLDAKLPVIKDVPIVTLGEALDILGKPDTQIDLDPTDEVKLCNYARDNWDSEFVFVEKFPSAKRPFYIMDSENGNSESFDLLFRGMEIASGGQRIHDYHEQLAKLERYGLNADDYESFLENHKYGMPPHGGLAIGLERFAMKLLSLGNIREASLFPRDMRHLLP